MSLVSKLSVSLFALVMMVGFSGKAFAADAATGTVKGTVTGVDGKPAANIAVKVLPPMQAKGDKPAPKAAAGEKPKGPVAIKEGTTNDKGEFTLTDIPAGDYSVIAGSKEAGMGREKVTVKAGETETVSITLKVRKAK